MTYAVLFAASAPLSEIPEERLDELHQMVASLEFEAQGELIRARDRLEAERQETLRRLAGLTQDFDAVVAASRDTNADDEHEPEGATIAFERSQVVALVQQAKHHLDEIDAAAERVFAGTYGTCENCCREIGEGRLEARPVARTCIGCATSGR